MGSITWSEMGQQNKQAKKVYRSGDLLVVMSHLES